MGLPEMNRVRIGICGLGTVASGVVNVLRRNAEAINARAGCEVVIELIDDLFDVGEVICIELCCIQPCPHLVRIGSGGF